MVLGYFENVERLLIGFYQRSVPDNNILSIIEGTLTGEGIGQDKLGTQYALDGLNAGFAYGQRISPAWFNVSRHYFRRAKGDEDLFEGARLMESNDWDNAIIALERALENGHKKVRGKAAHNLAVIYEINGDLDKAKEYASLAWGKYKEKESRDYGYDLTRRMQNEAILDQQLQRVKDQ